MSPHPFSEGRNHEPAAAEVSEYDRFGPWIDKVTVPDNLPRLFRTYPLDSSATRHCTQGRDRGHGSVRPSRDPRSDRRGASPIYPGVTIVTIGAGEWTTAFAVPTNSQSERVLGAASSSLVG